MRAGAGGSGTPSPSAARARSLWNTVQAGSRAGLAGGRETDQPASQWHPQSRDTEGHWDDTETEPGSKGVWGLRTPWEKQWPSSACQKRSPGRLLPGKPPRRALELIPARAPGAPSWEHHSTLLMDRSDRLRKTRRGAARAVKKLIENSNKSLMNT